MATLQEYYNQLAPIYEPQIASLKAQEASLAPQYQAQKSALEQARINAFRNISNTASARGMAFSGFTPEQEAQYTGTTYLPAMANLETQQLKSKQSLIDAINAANADRYAKSLGYYESAQQAEAANQAAIEAARIKATATNRSSGSSGGGGGSGTFETGFYYTPSKSGGYSFYNDKGKPVTAYTYAANTGQSIRSLLAMSNDKTDEKIVSLIDSGASLAELRKKYPYVFNG